MSEMLERVAAAIEDAADREAGEGEYISCAMAQAAAKAAIEAMRDYLREYAKQFPFEDLRRPMVEACWSGIEKDLMIDEALK